MAITNGYGHTTNGDSMLSTLGWACEELFGSYFINGYHRRLMNMIIYHIFAVCID